MMQRCCGVAWASLLIAAGCAPTVLNTRSESELVRTETITSPGHARRVTAVLSNIDGGATLLVSAQETCDEQTVRIVHRREVLEKKASVDGQVLLYVLAAAGGAIGTALLVDAQNVPPAGDPATVNPVGRTGAQTWGGVTLGVGAGFFALGIGTTVRGQNQVTDLGEAREPSGASKQVICNEHPVSREEVTLFIPGFAPVHLRPTDIEGKADLRWDELVEASAESVVGQDVANISARVSGKEVPVQVVQEAAAAIDKLRATGKAARRNEVAQEALDAARRALEDGDFDAAELNAGRFAAAGGNVSELRVELAKARQAKAKSLLAKAWEAVKANRPEEARDAHRGAVALGVDDERLDASIEQTPAAKRQRREEERERLAERKRELAAKQAAKKNAEHKAQALFAQRCPLIYENFRQHELLVTIINKWAMEKLGTRMTTAQAYSALKSLGSKSTFVRACRLRAAETTQCGPPRDRTTREALGDGPDGQPLARWQAWGYGSELDCMEKRPDSILRMVPFHTCGLGADDVTIRGVCLAIAADPDL